MSFFDSLDIAASGLTAERMRMDVTAENLANAQTTRGANGQPYQRQEVVLQQAGSSFGATLAGAMGTLGGPASAPVAGGVQVAGIVSDPTPDKLVYDPGNPDANAQGYVRMPNVNPVTEMVDLISESRSYEADVTAMQTAKQMYTKTLDLLK
jgi:flagellar basal-body rod protein FlgC